MTRVQGGASMPVHITGTEVPASGLELTGSLPAGTNLIGHVVLDPSGAVIGHVVVDSGSINIAGPVPVTGTFYPATQPVSAAALPLPAGAATAGGQTDGTQRAVLNAGSAVIGHVVIDSGFLTVLPQAVGTHANAWDATSVGVAGKSAAIDCQYVSLITVFGSTDATTVISVEVSQNNVNFYPVAGLTASLGVGGGPFGITGTIGARYVRLSSTLATTITATIAGKS